MGVRKHIRSRCELAQGLQFRRGCVWNSRIVISSLWILKVLERGSAVTGQSDGTFDLLSYRYRVILSMSTITARIANCLKWISIFFCLIDFKTPRSWILNGEESVEWINQSSGAILFKQVARCNWTLTWSRVAEYIRAAWVNSCTRGSILIVKNLISQGYRSQSRTVRFLGYFPVGKFDDRGMIIYAANADCIIIPSIDILLCFYFSSVCIYLEIGRILSVSGRAVSCFKRALTEISAQSGMSVREEINMSSCGNV